MTGPLNPKSSEIEQFFCMILVVYLYHRIFYPVVAVFFYQTGSWVKKGISSASKVRNYRKKVLHLYRSTRLVPVTRYVSCASEIVWDGWDEPVPAVCGVAPVAALVPVCPAGTYRHYRGTTTVRPNHQVGYPGTYSSMTSTIRCQDTPNCIPYQTHA